MSKDYYNLLDMELILKATPLSSSITLLINFSALDLYDNRNEY